jgi:hypothetical protein
LNANDFVTTFAFSKLYPFLKAHDAVKDTIIQWFWQHSPEWNAATQETFDAEAERRLIQRCNRPDVEIDFVLLNDAIQRGVRKRIPGRLRHRQFIGYDRVTGKEVYAETQLEDDACQSAWLALLERRAFGGRDANVAGQTAGRRQVRQIERIVPVSQLTLPAADSEDPESEPLAPWDNQPVTRRAGSDPAVYALIDELQEDIRRQIIAQFAKERPEDYKFLVEYIGSKGKTRHTAQERRRAKTIIDRLRRIESTECFPSKIKSPRNTNV